MTRRTSSFRSPIAAPRAGRAASALALGAWLSLATGLPGAATAADDSPPCTLSKGDSPVARACSEGGVTKAKAVMKDLTKRSRAAGMKVVCDDCHKDETNFALTDDGRERFDKMLALIADQSPKPKK